jgi:hypothetical protein
VPISAPRCKIAEASPSFTIGAAENSHSVSIAAIRNDENAFRLKDTSGALQHATTDWHAIPCDGFN